MTVKIPDTLVIVLSILLIFISLTWLVPAGEYARKVVNGTNLLVPNSYQEVSPNPQGVTDFLKAPIRGFIDSAQIIAFIFIVGGAFGILNRTGAIEAGLQSIVRLNFSYPRYKKLLIPLVMTLFSLAGATFGMSEELLVFILITIPLSYALGYDTIVGVAMPFIGAGAGFAGAFSNPFTIGIAQGIAEIPVFSGWEYRLVVWFVMTSVAIFYVMRYANKIEKNPEQSSMYEIDKQIKTEGLGNAEELKMTFARKILLLILGFALGLLVYGVNVFDWYMNEIAALFFALGLIAVPISRIGMQSAVDGFTHGAKDMMTACLVVAICKGILMVATDGKIIDTLLFYVSGAVNGLPKAVSIEVMFLVQSGLNFFVPSGSGQAALTMPIMAPLSDLLGISRQTSVLAFQFGDGLSNMIIPTSGVTMGILSLAKIPYEKWFRWVLPLMVLFFLAAMLLLLPPVVLFDWK